jgi:hypothetical protein
MTKQNKTLLNELHLKVQHERFPSMPVHCIPPYKKSDNSTNGLTSCVIDFINYSGYQAERINTTGRMLNNKKVITDVVGFKRKIGTDKWIKGTGTKGSADISSTIKGKSVKIEIKFDKDRQSEAQKDYQKAIENAGGTYIIVRNFDDFIHWYDNFIKNFQ